MLDEILAQIDHSGLTSDEEVKKEVSDFMTRMITSRNEKNLRTSQTAAEHIADYLLANNRKKLIRMSWKDAKRLAAEWQERNIKKSNGIVETEQDTEVVATYNKGMRLVKLVGKAAFQREGHMMRHCVGSYYNSLSEGTEVYSLRDENNNPHCTFEVNKTSVNQVKGKGNGPIHPKYVQFVIDAIQNHFKLQVRDSEVENLGYKKVEGEALAFLEKYYELKWISFQGSRFIYKSCLENPVEKKAS